MEQKSGLNRSLRDLAVTNPDLSILNDTELMPVFAEESFGPYRLLSHLVTGENVIYVNCEILVHG